MARELKWKTLSSKQLLKDKWTDVRADVCQRPDGTIIEPFYVYGFPDYTCAVAITKDGKVIFETTDKNNPWDGKNQHTDQLVPEGSEYIWKVTLMNPEKYEKNEYRGTITRK